MQTTINARVSKEEKRDKTFYLQRQNKIKWLVNHKCRFGITGPIVLYLHGQAKCYAMMHIFVHVDTMNKHPSRRTCSSCINFRSESKDILQK